MLAPLNGLWLIIFLLVPLLIMQRLLHREIQTILLLLTRRSDIALTIFAILFFPGVLLHEGSHWLMARLLGVKTGRFSLIPKPLANGRLRLGYVETATPDIVRDSLIGLAPLLSGGIFVTFAGVVQLNLDDLWLAIKSEDFSFEMIRILINQPDFWIWFYLVLAVSSTMLPSASDRKAWLPVSLFLGVVVLIGVIAGAGPWIIEHLYEPIGRAFYAFALVLGISLLVHLILILPMWAIHQFLSYIFKMDVV